MKNSEKITLFFIGGSGVFTFIWFLLNWTGVPYNLLSGLILLVILLVLFFIFGKPSFNFNLDYFKNLNLIEKIFLALIIFMCLSALIQTIYWPIRYWDSMVLYDFRAQVFAQTGYMDSAIAKGQFFGYPLLTSLIHTFIYLLGFSNSLFYYSLLYICLVVLFFENVKKFNLSRQMTMLLTLMAALSPRLFDHTQWGYTNLPYTIYIIFASVYLYWGIRNKNINSYLVSALMVGLSTWTRTAEPFWLVYIVASIFTAIIIKKWYWPFIYTFFIALMMFPWRYYQSLFNEGNLNVAEQVANTSIAVVKNLGTTIIFPVIEFMTQNVIKAYLLYFVLLGVIIIIKLAKKSKNWLFGTLIILNLGITLGGVLIFAKYTDYWRDIPDSLSRMVMFLPIMILFLGAELLSELKKG